VKKTRQSDLDPMAQVGHWVLAVVSTNSRGREVAQWMKYRYASPLGDALRDALEHSEFNHGIRIIVAPEHQVPWFGTVSLDALDIAADTHAATKEERQ